MTGLNWNFVFTIINLIVLYLLMQKFLYRPIMSIMQQREQLIKTQLDSAKNTEQEAFALKEKYETSLASVEKEADLILNRSRSRAQAEYDLILQDANAAAKQVMKETEKEIETEWEKAIQNISDEIAALAVSAAEKAIGQQKSGVF
ncbi:F0F1 ATP synthase subunit B [Anaerovorax sp. IOR16]|uniref:F0F1 ATP synthase subunit B n=1 Tax=Anaerovorax sp. IOR16 TaxID=2773458 RepID=UPI0019D0179B|nr:F0F1 ATP synthase subunit B [Anaerovorax sp. IOR16]